jgi:uncharacterized protein (DUF58 family)
MDYSIDRNRIEQFGSLEFLARQVVEGFIVGLHQSPYHGFSVEFAEHRLYNSGESTKHIDWKLYGRTDRMYVKKYEEETNLRCQVIIDNSSSMYYPVIKKPSIDNPNKITFAIYATAALMNLLKRQRDAVGISVFSDHVELTTRAKSSSVHHKYLYTEMEKMLSPISTETKRKTLATDALHQIAENIHQRSLVVLFSDMFDTNADPVELFSALQHLKYNKHEVILFHVTDKGSEIDFNFENRPHRFIDMESNREIKLNPHEVREAYVKRARDFSQELKMKCGQHRIDFVEADISKGFEHILLSYLLKREKLY